MTSPPSSAQQQPEAPNTAEPGRRALCPVSTSRRLLLQSLFLAWFLLPTSAGASESPTRITLAAVGDVMLARSVGAKIDRWGVHYPFKQVAEALTAADIAVCNLECPLADKASKVAKAYSFKADLATGQCLVLAGFDIVSLANNHALDCRRAGLLETMERLRLKRVRWCGAGTDRQTAEAPVVLVKNGVRIAFLAFSQFAPKGALPPPEAPTIAYGSVETIRRQIADACQQADVVVVSFHWGVEYASRPSSLQVKWARLAVDSGADLVLGHHPHILQGFEVRDNGGRRGRRSLIAYSLGNFVFDQQGVRQRESVILHCELRKHGVHAVSVRPVRLAGYRPRLATDKESKLTLSRLAKLTSARATTLRGASIVLRPPTAVARLPAGRGRDHSPSPHPRPPDTRR